MESIEIITPPSVPAVSLETAKDFLRIDHTADDQVIDILLWGATERCELFTGRAFIKRRLAVYLDEPEVEVFLPYAPVISLEAVITIDGETFEGYELDEVGGRLRLKEDYSFPDYKGFKSLRVEYEAGYGETEDAVPPLVKVAILKTVAFWYENRMEAYQLPQEAKDFLFPYVRKVV